MSVKNQIISILGFVSTYSLYPDSFSLLKKKISWFGNYIITSHGPTPRKEQSPGQTNTETDNFMSKAIFTTDFTLNTVGMKIKIIEKTYLGPKPHTKEIMMGKLKFWL